MIYKVKVYNLTNYQKLLNMLYKRKLIHKIINIKHKIILIIKMYKIIYLNYLIIFYIENKE